MTDALKQFRFKNRWSFDEIRQVLWCANEQGRGVIAVRVCPVVGQLSGTIQIDTDNSVVGQLSLIRMTEEPFKFLCMQNTNKETSRLFTLLRHPSQF